MTAKEWLDGRADEIDHATFRKLVSKDDLKSIEADLGYDRSRPMSGDPYISYHLDAHSGIPYFVWSATEHVFAEPSEIEALERHALNQEFLEEEGVLVIDRIGRMAGQPPEDPDFEGDLQDEVLEKVIMHAGSFIVVEDDVTPPAYVTATIERALAHAGEGRVARLRADDLGDLDPAEYCAEIAQDRAFEGLLQVPGSSAASDSPTP
jgi:hypothetical protein